MEHGGYVNDTHSGFFGQTMAAATEKTKDWVETPELKWHRQNFFANPEKSVVFGLDFTQPGMTKFRDKWENPIVMTNRKGDRIPVPFIANVPINISIVQ